MVTKETESLAVRVKSLTHKYVKKLDSEKDLDCLSKILLAHEDWIERRLKVEEDFKQTDIILYYKRFSSEAAGYARDEELTKYNAFISYLKEELSFIEEATEALKKNKEAIDYLRVIYERQPSWVYAAFWLGKLYSLESDEKWNARKYLMTFLKRSEPLEVRGRRGPRGG